MSRAVLFTLTEKAYEKLRNIERGARSRIISELLESSSDNPNQEIANPEKVTPEPQDKKLRIKSPTSTDNSETINKPTSTSKPEAASALKDLKEYIQGTRKPSSQSSQRSAQ